ncbi:hypothetical protein INT45_008325, partial [Circinella minor]
DNEDQMSEISTTRALSHQGSMAVDQDTQESSSVIMEADTATGPKCKRNWMVENKWVIVKKLPNSRKEFRCQWESVTGRICNHPTMTDKKGSTSNMLNHIKSKHSITASSPAKGESPISRGIGSLDLFLTPQAPTVVFSKKNILSNYHGRSHCFSRLVHGSRTTNLATIVVHCAFGSLITRSETAIGHHY